MSFQFPLAHDAQAMLGIGHGSGHVLGQPEGEVELVESVHQAIEVGGFDRGGVVQVPPKQEFRDALGG